MLWARRARTTRALLLLLCALLLLLVLYCIFFAFCFCFYLSVCFVTRSNRTTTCAGTRGGKGRSRSGQHVHGRFIGLSRAGRGQVEEQGGRALASYLD
jgi:hypothetical protein